MLAILDYKAGNQTSVHRALSAIGVAAAITADPAALLAADGVIFPGVGAAAQAMGHLKASGLDATLRQIVEQKTPLLGICLGCQILLENSEESNTPTLGIVPGFCRRFDPAWKDGAEPIRIPHMGWNSLDFTPNPEDPAQRILEGIEPGSQVYFVHGYYPDPPKEMHIAATTYGQTFSSVYGRAGLWAAQFHPEKSAGPGLRLLANFARYCEEVRHG